MMGLGAGGANPLGGGMGAGAFPAAPVAPVVPPPTPGDNLFSHLLGALQDPHTAAIQMAKNGMSPAAFSKDLQTAQAAQGNRLASVLKGNSQNDRLMGAEKGDQLRTIISGKPDYVEKATPNRFLGQDVEPAVKSGVSRVYDDLMQPVGGQTGEGWFNRIFGTNTPPTPQTEGTSALMGGNAANRGGQQTMPIAPPIQPPVQAQPAMGQKWRQGSTLYPENSNAQPVPATLPEAVKQYISSTLQPPAPLQDTLQPEQSLAMKAPKTPISQEQAPQVSTAQTATSSFGRLDQGMREDRLQPAQPPSTYPTASAQTSYSLHGGATRADALMNMDPQFMSALEKMYAAAPPEVQKELGLTSAYRNYNKQKELYDKSDKSGKSVAAPGHSRHNFGMSADLYGFGLREGGPKVSDTTRQWVSQNAKSFGLGFPVKGEPWHIERMTPEGKRMPLPMVPDEVAQRGNIPQFNLKQRAANTPQRMMAERLIKPEFRDLMASIGPSYGVTPDYLQRVAMIESGGNPDAHNASSGADGMYQFVPGTAKQYRVNSKDPKDSIRGASELAADNIKSLKKALGRDPSWAEVYLAHQQGAAGAAALLKNPNAMAVDTLGRDAVIGNGGTSGMTNQEFANLWIDKYNGTGGGGAGGAGGETISGGEGSNYGGATGGTATSGGGGGGSTLDPTAEPDYSGVGGDSSSSDKDKRIPAPGVVSPSQGSFDPEKSQMMKLMLMMMAGRGGAISPTIAQLMSGGVQKNG